MTNSEPTDRATHVRGDDIEAITSYSDHLDIVAEILRKMPGERRQVYEARIEEIARRAVDPNLNLAVIGEFCSGKSTFINGLLRSRLLKAACVANTASVTRIRKGATLVLTASFSDGSTVTVRGDDFELLRQSIVARQPAAASDTSLKDLLDRLTSDPVVADDVHEIDLTVPTEQLDDNIVILDTPGIGAGVEAAKNHARVTQRVVTELADCALVLIPSANPMTATLITFLETYARPFLHRCIFVITAMDRQDEQEREETREYVRSRLREILGIESPFVLQSAAISVIPSADTVADSLQESWAHWRSEFVVLEKAVRAALMRERTVIIAEHLIRLLQELISEMESELAENAAAMKEEERILNENTVERLEVILGALAVRSTQDVEERRQLIHRQTEVHRNSLAGAAKEYVFNIINRAGWNVKNYASAVHPEVVRGVEHYGRHYAQVVDQDLGALRQRCEILSAEFTKRFEQSYRELPSLGIPVSVPSVSIAPLPNPAAFRSAADHAARQGVTDQRRATTGEVGGGVLMTVFLGPVGALLLSIGGCVAGCSMERGGSPGGAFVGWLLGIVLGFVLAGLLGAQMGKGVASWTGPSLKDRQHMIRTHLSNDIEAYFTQTQKQFDAHVDGTARDVLASFRSAADRHKSAYGDAVELLRREHEEKRRTVATRIATTEVDGAELRRRAQRLDAVRRRLAASRVPT